MALSVALAMQQQADAGISVQGTFWGYSYEGSCHANNLKDPVGVVFINGNGAYNHVYEHAKLGNHGGWGQKGGGQLFRDDVSLCSSSDDSAASNNGGAGCIDRYHMRYEVAWSQEGGQSYAATPHFDDGNVQVFPPSCYHCVPTNGFDMGKADVYTNWVSSGLHPGATSHYWGNTAKAMQACGYQSGGNGWVYYINMGGNP